MSDEEYKKLAQQDQDVLNFFNKDNEMVNNLIRNSVPGKGKGKRRVIVNWKNATKLVAIIAVLILLIGNLCVSLSEFVAANKAALKENKAFDKVLASSEMDEVVKEAQNTYRAPGKSEYATDHDTYKIGEHLVLESEDFHQDLYITAHEISKKYDDATEEKVMDSVLKQVSNINDEENPNHVLDYASWEDYCIKHGFVDKDGNADFEKYMTEMKSHLASEEETNDFKDEHGLRSFR